MIKKLIPLFRFSLLLVTLALAPAGSAWAIGPVTIKWIKMCGFPNNFEHSLWVAGLSDGSKVWSYFNPNQGRAGIYSMLLAAYMADREIHYENPVVDVKVVCGETTTHYVDAKPGSDTAIMLGNK